MKAITIRQPWAGSILYHGKDVENRSRNIAGDYRGLLAIHVSKRHDYVAQNGPHNDALGFIDQHNTYGWGAIIGTVNLWAVHRATPGNLCCPRGDTRWGMADHWHLCLTDPKPLVTPIPTRGQLGLWTPPADVLDDVDHAHDRLRPRLWCETCQHVHIDTIPGVTWQCRDCGWGQWSEVDAALHVERCLGHEPYRVGHWMPDRLRDARRAGADRVAEGVRKWAALNEIAAVPLDWAGLGEFLDARSPSTRYDSTEASA